ncbi:predicted protein [Histoplasma capsulatum G186AR]|uniref:Uncharacterized protein n=1 Tax=Ajellomyces capsulatus (strain G186AR / H82 / ATCC MYA-2454 / RMSCC 2432) TaxID=447093 RepID=C0NC20_AJECG|nr:uncharacterized protein HCBG_00666 [Histoplasma capsulatum G186AR]EEH11211.1 predicted protein [Histoplasma capsulatum G186AR]
MVALSKSQRRSNPCNHPVIKTEAYRTLDRFSSLKRIIVCGYSRKTLCKILLISYSKPCLDHFFAYPGRRGFLLDPWLHTDTIGLSAPKIISRNKPQSRLARNQLVKVKVH